MTTQNPDDPRTDEEAFAAGLKRGEAHHEAHGFYSTPPKGIGKLDASQLPASMIREAQAQAGGLG